MTKTATAEIAVIGIDIGKNSFHVVGLDKRGEIVLRQKWSRGQIEARLANLTPCLVGMEACNGAHHLARRLNALGHDARLMPAKYVRPYARGQKNDFNDAEAIAEAVQRPTMKFVAAKTAGQLDLQALHRVRERLFSQRTGILNQIRAFLLEREIAVRQGQRFLRTELPIILGARTDVLSPRMVHMIEDLAADWRRLSAVSFEAIAREAKACYVLGLSATVTRKDGHHPIIFMQCGPVRYRVDARTQATERPFEHKVAFRQTNFRAARNMPGENLAIQELYAQIAMDQTRNDLIFEDILRALEAGRSPVVITERKDHLGLLAERLSKFAKNVVVLRGGMSARELQEKANALSTIPESEERLIIATGRYLGEGFDDARLDTLFLTMPISWRGTLAQYAGRLHRFHAAKKEVIVFDYVDANEPMLAKIARRREAGYRALGYKAVDRGELDRLIAARRIKAQSV